MRLNKYIAEQTGRSRREADELIRQGRVKLSQTGSQTTARLGQQMTESDKVLIDGRLVEPRRRQTTIILNKPVGYLSSRRSQGGDPTIYDLLPARYRQLKTAGRLDKDSSGLMVLSSDGDLIQRLTHPRYRKQKVYQVQLDQPLQPIHQQMIADIGIDLPDGTSKLGLEESPRPFLDISIYKPVPEENSKPFLDMPVPPKRSEPGDTPIPSPSLLRKLGLGGDPVARSAPLVDKGGDMSKNGFRIFWVASMHEGRNRQIRRTFAALGYTVVRLHRVQLGDYRLGDLAAGNFRQISV